MASASFTTAFLAFAMAVMCASASHSVYRAQLKGSESTPPVNSPGYGNAVVAVYNSSYGNGTFVIGGIDDTFMGHVHIGPAGSAGPAAVWAYNITDITGKWQPITVSRGTMKGTFWFNPTTTGAANALSTGNAYFNVHTSKYPGGEIRGQFARAN